MRRMIGIYTVCVERISIEYGINQTLLLLEMDQSKELKQKSPLGINGLK